MHDSMGLNGWLIYAVDVLVYGSLLAALALVVDAVRRRPSDFGKTGKVLWIGLQALYLFLGVLAFLVDIGSVLATVIGVMLLVALVQQVAYLLRVVYPTPERLAARELAVTSVHDLPEEPLT